jgi:hypothetical protein
MKTKRMDTLKSLLILIAVILLSHATNLFPWWGFVIPVIITGIILKNKEWNVSFFGTGFLAGFLVWTVANFYFDWAFPGDILNNLGNLLFVPKLLVILISGIIGGLISGLAFYTGKSILATKSVPELK